MESEGRGQLVRAKGKSQHRSTGTKWGESYSEILVGEGRVCGRGPKGDLNADLLKVNGEQQLMRTMRTSQRETH